MFQEWAIYIGFVSRGSFSYQTREVYALRSQKPIVMVLFLGDQSATMFCERLSRISTIPPKDIDAERSSHSFGKQCAVWCAICDSKQHPG